MPIKEHDSGVLCRPLPEHGLQVGDVGSLVFVHRESTAYEVEFIAGEGNTEGVVTLNPENIRPKKTGASRRTPRHRLITD